MLALHFLVDFVDLFCVMLFCFSILRGISIVGPRRMAFTKNSEKGGSVVDSICEGESLPCHLELQG